VGRRSDWHQTSHEEAIAFIGTNAFCPSHLRSKIDRNASPAIGTAADQPATRNIRKRMEWRKQETPQRCNERRATAAARNHPFDYLLVRGINPQVVDQAARDEFVAPHTR